MTENEAKEYMENEVECIKRASHCDRNCLKCELVKEEEPLIESYKMAIQALEEIQQYRANGTVEGYERAIQSSIENYNLYRECKAKLQEYEAIGTIEDYWKLNEMCKEYSAIGTIEEFETLKEKSVAKKPIKRTRFNLTVFNCPICNAELYSYQRFCDECGQSILNDYE